MYTLGWHYLVWEELERTDTVLRARCKAHLDRLEKLQPGTSHGLKLEKVHTNITELKIKWNKQECRFLFFLQNQVLYIVNFFQKKTRTTPVREIDIAVVRMRDIQLGRATIIYRTLH
jgi:phage-related protein